MNTETFELELPFAPSVFAARQDALRSLLVDYGVAAAIYVTPEELYYLTGYNTPGYYYGFQALIVPVDGDAFMVCRLVEESNVLARSTIERCHIYRDGDNPPTIAVRALAQEGVTSGKVALSADQNSISAAHYLSLATGIGKERLVPEQNLLGRLRAIKSDAEVAYMRVAAKVSAAGLRAAVNATVVGSTEDDVAAECYAALIRAGGEYPGMPPMIASGHRAGLGHATWEGHREIRDGDIVILEVPGCVQRYHACQLRCVSVGEPSAANRSRMDAALAARSSALETIRPGALSQDVDRALRGPIEAAGFGGHHLHRAGYGLGIAYPPHWDEGQIISLREGETWELQSNMVFHLLPALYFYNETLIGCTETVRVTDDGYELLTTSFPEAFLGAGMGGAVA